MNRSIRPQEVTLIHQQSISGRGSFGGLRHVLLPVLAIIVSCTATPLVRPDGSIGNAPSSTASRVSFMASVSPASVSPSAVVERGAHTSGATTATSERTVPPSSLTGPSVAATPMVVIRMLPEGGTCAYDPALLLPAMVIYSDGAVLTIRGGGYFCDSPPPILAGWADPNRVSARLNSYFASADSHVDMSRAGNTIGIADATTTELTYITGNRSIRSAAAYALDVDGLESDLPPVLVHARSAMRTVTAALTAMAAGRRTAWAPRNLAVVNPEPAPIAVIAPARWPVPINLALKAVLAGPKGSCIGLSQQESAAVAQLQRSRPSLSQWSIGGRTRPLALGVVLPGIPPCGS